MQRKLYVEVKIRVFINVDEDIETDVLMNEIDYDFHNGDGYEVVDTEFVDYEVIDRK